MSTLSAGTPTVATTEELAELARTALRRCGADLDTLPGMPGTDRITASSPLTGETLFKVSASTPTDVEAAIQAAHEAFRPPRGLRGTAEERVGCRPQQQTGGVRGGDELPGVGELRGDGFLDVHMPVGRQRAAATISTRSPFMAPPVLARHPTNSHAP